MVGDSEDLQIHVVVHVKGLINITENVKHNHDATSANPNKIPQCNCVNMTV